ncbi:MAG: Aerotolerance-related exported protein [Candidatus Nomurabacteria bacterium GW2011_GWF2_35_66]|uniref:Aerotolerance-related exported protein n=1 Tax=Candidatus Nomurabacteria bacterium GW2011_GWE1_35_16 TaxID=1618761 RepID=A0A0G0BSM3_9BACT|nr:MAG: Aerotolerance-related exported protein [Candidatus Nomurabacteria bacterium GW2011_GWF1_34_20]KKP63476.1 MAG: Aerotolerance-related exported protein [Candidatus Nomurabacteria bacterium GW2011_GWE2_34_25]KKP66656.1 MAG: Aerotolerance-related exported protein [Candidatus Nomurabacteria bacterium GW2011_GWE1_35_16]KKP83764.1 MAG: Aerotolerance-related exported protein [Candidatus Nomurabacteria bacterium GW2011_GWF2_35_66]HAE36455.1 hypothetical protein [Candidatus Nomurabacteria bacteriu
METGQTQKPNIDDEISATRKELEEARAMAQALLDKKKKKSSEPINKDTDKDPTGEEKDKGKGGDTDKEPPIDTENKGANPNPEPTSGQISPEEIKTLEQLIADAEAVNKAKLEANKFGGSVLRGLSKWEKFGQGEAGPKGFAKRMTKMGINLALIGLISSVGVQELAENDIGTATSLAGGIFSKIGMKLGIGLGMGVSMDIIGNSGASDKVKKWLPKVIGIGFVGAAFLTPAGLAAGATAGGAFALGLLSQKFNGKFTDEKILAREQEAKNEFLKKIKAENRELNEDSIKQIEQEYTKIFNKYKRQRIWGKLLDGASKLTVGSVISGLALEVSGEIHDHMKTDQPTELGIKQEEAIVDDKEVELKTMTHAMGSETDSGEQQDATHMRSGAGGKILSESELKNHTGGMSNADIKSAFGDNQVETNATEVKDTVESKQTEAGIAGIKDSVEIKDTVEVKSGVEIKTETKDSVEIKNTAEVKSEGVKDTAEVKQATEIKDTEHVKSGAEAKTEEVKDTTSVKSEPAVKIESDASGTDKTVSVDFSSKGAIQTILDIKEQIRHEYPDISKAPQEDQEFMKTDATHQAIRLGLYNPNDPEESAFVLKGSTLNYSHGNLTLHEIKTGEDHVLIQTKGTEQTIEKYDGKMFDSDHSGTKIEGSTNTPSSNPEITNTPHLGPNGLPETVEGSTIIDTPHITPGGEYNEDPTTYLHPEEEAVSKHAETPVKNNSEDQTGAPHKNPDEHPVKPATKEDADSVKDSTHHELTSKEMRQIERVSNHNIHKIFPNNYEDQNWHEAKNMDAYKLYHLKVGEVSDEYKPLHHYLHKLSSVTGIKPLPGDNMYLPQTNDQFINDALKVAAEIGKLDKVKL